MSTPVYTFEQARALIPQVREITAAAHDRVRQLTAEIQRTPAGSARAQKLREWINTVVRDWAERIEALGALPKGVWTVDFDSGQGFYYCWSHDEEHLAFFHMYEDGFAGRKPLNHTHVTGSTPVVLN